MLPTTTKSCTLYDYDVVFPVACGADGLGCWIGNGAAFLMGGFWGQASIWYGR